MATDLPDTPESREESYLADIAGQDVELPEKPLSRKEQYLAYIAENGGGGGGGTSNFNQLSNRPKYNGATMTGDTSIPEVKTYTAGSNVSISDGNVISATDTTYSNFTGTDGTAAGTAGLVPAPATTDAGKFLKADGTWDTAGGGGGGGGIKFLSASDFNYDDGETGSFNSIALWLLDDGIYFMPSNYTTVPVKGCLDGNNADRFNYDIQHGNFFCFIKAGNSFWMFVNTSNLDSTIYANRSIYFCTINGINGWFGYDNSRQLATRGELPS